MSNLVTLDRGKIFFNKAKKARILRQKTTWENIQTYPQEDWAQILLEIWPDNLPQYIFNHAPQDVIDEYLEYHLRGIVTQKGMLSLNQFIKENQSNEE